MPPRRNLDFIRSSSNLNLFVNSQIILHEDTRIATMTFADLRLRIARITDPSKLYAFSKRLGYYIENSTRITNVVHLTPRLAVTIQNAVETKLRNYGFNPESGERLGHTAGIWTHDVSGGFLLRGERLRPVPIREVARVEGLYSAVQPTRTSTTVPASQTRSPKTTLAAGLMQNGEDMLCCMFAMPKCRGNVCASWRSLDGGDIGYCGLAGKPETPKLANDKIRTITREAQ